jgi:hypothetical protein
MSQFLVRLISGFFHISFIVPFRDSPSQPHIRRWGGGHLLVTCGNRTPYSCRSDTQSAEASGCPKLICTREKLGKRSDYIHPKFTETDIKERLVKRKGIFLDA